MVCAIYLHHRYLAVPSASVRLLVVEDEVDLAEALARGLRQQGYAVDVAFDGEDALSHLALNTYDLVCLDLNLPLVDGREVCRRLRSDPAYAPDPDVATPRVLMLTARDTVDDRVVGLDDGADDYLVKPFAFTELTARIRTLLRRDAGRSGAVLRVGDLVLDTARFEASVAGRLLDLTAKEFALLRYFMAHPGDVLSQEHLLEHVWDEHADPFTNTVRVTVGTLRRKLAGSVSGAVVTSTTHAGRAPGADGAPGADSAYHQAIETVVGVGYRLRAER